MIPEGVEINISEIADLISQELSSHIIFQPEGEADALAVWAVR